MTDDQTWVLFWAVHCAPVVVFVQRADDGVQYVFLPIIREHCDECGLRH